MISNNHGRPCTYIYIYIYIFNLFSAVRPSTPLYVMYSSVLLPKWAMESSIDSRRCIMHQVSHDIDRVDSPRRSCLRNRQPGLQPQDRHCSLAASADARGPRRQNRKWRQMTGVGRSDVTAPDRSIYAVRVHRRKGRRRGCVSDGLPRNLKA